MMREPVTIELSEPIEAHGESVVRLVVQEPRARHFRRLQMKPALTVGDILEVAVDLTGVPASSLDQLCATDTFRVVEVVGDFFPAVGDRTPPS